MIERISAVPEGAAIDMSGAGTAKRRIENRSIDYVPHAERHGKAWHQAPFWFTGNFLIGTLAIGFIGPSVGLSFVSTVIATVIGALFGTFFMAFHANQGPTMGLPQMIQSRAQFGVRGAIVPLFAASFQYVGFAVFGAIFAGSALQTTLGVDPHITYGVVMLASVVIAIVGYDLLHLVMRTLTYIVVPVFLILTVVAIATLHPHPAAAAGASSFTAWILQIGVVAGFQIGYSVYVSDYSRYLPADVSNRAVIGWTYLGAAFSAIWMIALGALIASSTDAVDALASVKAVGDHVFHGFGSIAVLAVVPSTAGATAICLYGSMLSAASVQEAFWPRTNTRGGVRALWIVLFGAVSTAITYAIPGSWLNSFSTFLLILLYVLIPWSAINLADYYFVRRGHYAITAIFNPDGVYGRWGWRGLGAYAIAEAAMVPFMSLSFYKGPVSTALHGADLSFLIGLVIGGGVYVLLTRGLDLGAEIDAIAASDATLGESAIRVAPRVGVAGSAEQVELA